MTKTSIIIISAQVGGYAGDVLAMLKELGSYEVLGFLENKPEFQDKLIEGIPILGTTDNLEQLCLSLPTNNFHIAVGDNVSRRDIYKKLKALGSNLITLIHPKAIVNKTAVIGKGCYIGPSSVIDREVHIGKVSIISSGCIIQHNTKIGVAVTMGSGVTVGKGVQIDDNTFIGMSSCITANVHIGSGLLIDTGSIVRNNLPSGTTMVDYAAKKYPKNIFLDSEPDITPKQKVYVAQPTLPDYQLLDEKFREIVKSRMLSNFAKYSTQLELNIQEVFAVNKALTFPNCTSALMLAVKTLDLSGEVILPSFTFSATGHSLVWNCLTPVFADIDPYTFNIDLDDVERKVTDRTSAIMAVHVFGNPCDVTRLEDIAKRHNLKLIFDSAHALGSKYDGTMIGCFGDVECFSLSGTKVITSAEGGIVTSNDKSLMDKIDLGRNYGAGNDYNCHYMGLNGKMSEFHAAIAIESLLLLSDSVRVRNEMVRLYTKRLSEIPGISFQYVPDEHVSTYKDFAIIIDKEVFGMDSGELITKLENEGIYSKRYFYPIHKMGVYQSINHRAEGLTNTVKLANNIICLPIYSHMNTDTIEKICFTIFRIWKSVN